MSQRNSARVDQLDRDLENNGLLTGESKDNYKRFRHLEMEKQDKFVRRSYWLCILLFIMSGISMTVAISQGMYHNVILAETVLTSVLGTIYVVLFILLCVCSGDSSLRIAILLFVSAFVGIVCGFMVGVNLKMVVSQLDDTHS